jgi:hypothetical protein
MSETSTIESEVTWPEPQSLESVLLDFDAPKVGRPRKGQEKQHGLDTGFYEAAEALTNAGLRPLAGAQERGEIRLQKESSRHRALIYLFAQGGTARNVFEQLGGRWDTENNRPISGTGEYSYQQLLNIRRQPWFQNELLEVIAENGSPLIEARLKLEQMASLETLIEIRDSKEEKGATRAACANSILDRFLGKPAQLVKTEAVASVSSHENEANELRERLKRLEAEALNLNPAFKTNT